MTYTIKGNTGDWEIVVGLEVHAQVNTHSKLFSGASTTYGAEPNTNVAFVDAGMPGMLPVINAAAIEQAVRTGLAIKAKINLNSVFDRKNYFYPDLPQGYQISQYLDPIVGEGELEVDMPDGSIKKVGVERIHLEQDAGKSLHEYSPHFSYIDLNRAGVALMEIVSKPDMRSPEEAGLYFKKLRAIVRYIGSCDGDLEKGNMRCDANVSVRRSSDAPYGTRCEIKNVNSVKFLMKAIEFEAERQVQILEAGGTINQETRLFDSTTGETRTMRSKEDAHDYRYFPDPDLLPLQLTQEFVANIKASLPELPDEKKHRYMKDFGLSVYDASVIVADQAVATYFETLVKKHDPKLSTVWLTAELFGRLNKLEKTIEESPVSAEQLGGLLALIEDNTISGKIAKDVLDIMLETGKSAADIVEEKGLKQVTDTGEIEKVIDAVLAANPDKVADYKGGKEKLFGFFVGQVMKESGGKANPAMLNELLKKKL
jgi:aspartyl-tRNA(Asn)/glutamyl-tRNA(Gln) amidotransferase subunit B